MGIEAREDDLPIWLRPASIALFVLLLVAVRMAVAAATGLVRDEGYYTLWSFWPSGGYLDHPPMVAWLVAAGRAIAGESEAGVRLFPVLSTAVISLAVYRTGRVLFDVRTAGLAVIWYNLTLAGGMIFVATPDAPVVAFWTLSLWAVAEFTRSRNANWWLLAGVLAGLALLSKYTAAFLGLGLLLYLLSDRRRRAWLRLWQVWAGGVLALLVWLPNLWWNLENDGVGLGFQARRLDDYGLNLGGFLGNLGDYFGGQVLASGVFLFIFVAIGTALVISRRELPTRAALALPLLTSLPILVFFLAYTLRFRVEANWPVAVWPMLSLVGAWAAVHLKPRQPLAAGVMAALRWAQVPLGVFVLGLIYVQALWQPFVLHPLVDRTSDMRGWPEVYANLADQARTHGAAWIVVVSGDYGLAGQMATYARFAGDGLPVEPMREAHRYGFMPPVDAALLDRTAILVAPSWMPAERIRGLFDEVQPLDTVVRRDAAQEFERFQVFVVSGPQPGSVEALTER